MGHMTPTPPAPTTPASPPTPPSPADRFSTDPGRPLASHPGAPLLHQAGDAIRLTLNRPEQHNRLDPADIDAMQGLLDDLERERNVRALVITGTGERTFSSGYTLDAIVTELDARFERMLDTLENLPVTTLAAINGGVYGGATDLSLCCDLRLGVQGTRMFMPAARFALHYYPGGMRRYVSRLGLTAAKKLFLTAMTIDEHEMLRIGFLNELVPREQMTGRVEAHLSALDQTDPGVVGTMKRNLNRLADGTADLQQMADDYARSLAADELRRRLHQLRGDRAGRRD